MRRKGRIYIFLVFVAIICTILLLRIPWRESEGFQDTSAKPKGIILDLIGGLGNLMYDFSIGYI